MSIYQSLCISMLIVLTALHISTYTYDYFPECSSWFASSDCFLLRSMNKLKRDWAWKNFLNTCCIVRMPCGIHPSCNSTTSSSKRYTSSILCCTWCTFKYYYHLRRPQFLSVHARSSRQRWNEQAHASSNRQRWKAKASDQHKHQWRQRVRSRTTAKYQGVTRTPWKATAKYESRRQPRWQATTKHQR